MEALGEWWAIQSMGFCFFSSSHRLITPWLPQKVSTIVPTLSVTMLKKTISEIKVSTPKKGKY